MKRRERRSRREGRSHAAAWLHSVQARSILATAVGFVVIVTLFMAAYAPKRYNVQVGQISRYTINASRDVVDQVTTEERRNAARNAVEPVYVTKEDATEEVMAALDAAFADLGRVQAYGETVRQNDDPNVRLSSRNFSKEELDYARGLLTSITLTDYQLRTLMRTLKSDLTTMENTLRIAVNNAMQTSVREGQEEQSLNVIKQLAGYSVPLTLMQAIVPSVLNQCVKPHPNLVIDHDETGKRQQDAANAVEPVRYLQGQCIVRSGEKVTKAQYAMLSSLSLLSDKRVDYKGYLGVGLQVAAAMLCMVLLELLQDRSFFADFRRVSVTILVMCIDAAMCVIMAHFANLYAAPVVMSAMLLTCLMGWRVAAPVGVGLSMLVAGVATTGTNASAGQVAELLMMNLTAVIISCRYLSRTSQRTQVVLCGLLVGVTDMICSAAIGMMTGVASSELLKIMIWEMGGTVLSGMLALGLQPVFEMTFNLATHSKLQELANPAHPLMRKLLIEAPGTYHHSIIVANLAEAASERIGADPALARTASYYHDVGKLKRPLYFKENQMGENLHDRTDPYVSAAIVTSHTRDGVAMAQKYRLPPEVQNIILEHHGDTPVMFFYHKACQLAPEKQINIDDFRYDGRRPTSSESAIVMLADTVEAAVRSMHNPTPDAIREFIAKLVQGKLDDGQLADAPLTLRDVHQIEEAFCTVLQGAFHERIEYPAVEMPRRNLAELDEKAAPVEAGQQKEAVQ